MIFVFFKVEWFILGRFFGGDGIGRNYEGGKGLWFDDLDEGRFYRGNVICRV